jgi:uncharacterized protein YqgV (UPF0045/DUF77 family)
MNNIVNLAIQVLPLVTAKDKYAVIDDAIALIEKSGMKYKVCPFETVVEGPYDRVMKLVDDIQHACFDSGAEELLINMKLQRRKSKDVFIDEKTGKYE